MSKCACCGVDDAGIARRFVVVETLSGRGDASAERKERIHGIIDGAMCRDCFAAELEKLAQKEAGNASRFVVAVLLAVLGVALAVLGLVMLNLSVLSIIGFALLVIDFIVFMPKIIAGRKRVAVMRSGTMDERIRDFGWQLITQEFERNGAKKNFYGFAQAFMPATGENHSVCLIELTSGMSSVKPNALVRRYGISLKTEDDIKKLALSR